MKNLLVPALLAGAMLATAPQAAFAQKNNQAAAPSGGVRVAGLGIADLNAVVANSDANRTAAQQRPTTYKAQIDAYNARATAVQNQLKPLVEKFQRDTRGRSPSARVAASMAAATAGSSSSSTHVG